MLSFRCVIAELFLEGQPLFELSQLLAYRRGQYDPSQHLEKVLSLSSLSKRSFNLKNINLVWWPVIIFSHNIMLNVLLLRHCSSTLAVHSSYSIKFNMFYFTPIWCGHNCLRHLFVLWWFSLTLCTLTFISYVLVIHWQIIFPFDCRSLILESAK